MDAPLQHAFKSSVKPVTRDHFYSINATMHCNTLQYPLPVPYLQLLYVPAFYQAKPDFFHFRVLGRLNGSPPTHLSIWVILRDIRQDDTFRGLFQG